MKTPRNLIAVCWCIGAMIWACQATALAQRGPTQWVLVDRSGSMRGFFATDQMSSLERLVRSGSGDFRSFYFIDERVIPQEGAVEFGARTLLHNALRHVLRARPQPHIVWFVTDNQPSGGGETESDRDLAAFYADLRSEQVARLCFFPLKLPFDGELYTLDDSLLGSYQGKRGLLVYALLLDEAFAEQYEKSVAAFEQSAGRALAGQTTVRRVSIKPLERETVSARLTPLPGSKLSVEGGTVVGSDFTEGSPIEGKFGIELESNFGLIKIDEAQIDAGVGEFRTSDFSTPNPKADIDPKVFREFQPGKSPPPFEVTLALEPVRVESSLSTILHSLGRKRGDIDGHIYISISVPPSKFSPAEALRNEFSTDKNIFSDPSQATQERIYKIGDLMQRMLPTEVQQIRPRINDSTEGRIPVRLSVRYLSAWRALLVIVPLLLLILALLLFFWLRRRIGAATYRLSWDDGRCRPCGDFSLAPLWGRQQIEIDRVVVANIRRSFSGISVTALPGYAVNDGRDRRLSDSGSHFTIVRRGDERSVDFRFARVGANGHRAPLGYGAEEDGSFSSSALYDPDDDPTPPPIVMPTFGDSDGRGAPADKHSSDISLGDLYN